jgi:hypothetical protein
MDPITLIVGALVAGAAAALKDSATDAVKGAYGALKKLVKRKLGDTPGAEITLAGHEQKPEVWKAPLEDALKTAGADNDPELVAVAQGLMELVDPEGAKAGKYQVINQGPVYGQTIGDKNVITQNFGHVGGVAGNPKGQ